MVILGSVFSKCLGGTLHKTIAQLSTLQPGLQSTLWLLTHSIRCALSTSVCIFEGFRVLGNIVCCLCRGGSIRYMYL